MLMSVLSWVPANRCRHRATLDLTWSCCLRAASSRRIWNSLSRTLSCHAESLFFFSSSRSNAASWTPCFQSANAICSMPLLCPIENFAIAPLTPAFPRSRLSCIFSTRVLCTTICHWTSNACCSASSFPAAANPSARRTAPRCPTLRFASAARFVSTITVCQPETDMRNLLLSWLVANRCRHRRTPRVWRRISRHPQKVDRTKPPSRWAITR
mmetsp:Transcript_13499/g.33893  ORF Transcript_13499/g.33893 Transcript_13499/m.33893 type:complete len:212 (-) Transcript_13499:735-1370(-)